MSGFWNDRPAPALLPSNPGRGAELTVGFANGERTWSEEVSLIEIAAAVLQRHGHTVTAEATWLLHPASEYLLLPQIVIMQPHDNGSVQTTTTIQIHHPTLAPEGIFEYQHSSGSSVEDSVARGFDMWAQTDFVTLLDAARPTPEVCMALELALPAQDGQQERLRRAILGPVAHLAQSPHQAAADDAHPFCSCCLLTNSFEAFKELFEGDSFYALRLFAMRDEQGVAQADCRVNGEDWAQGAAALRAYASTWPPAGYEFRKQYVVLRSIERPDAMALDSALDERS